MWDEIKEDFYAVFGSLPSSMQLYNNKEACEAITKYRNGSGYDYLVSFISLLKNEDFKQFSKSDINIIGFIYKDSVVDYHFLNSRDLIDKKYPPLYAFALPFSGLVGKDKHPFTVEVISKQPLCNPELIQSICEEKNILAAAAVIMSISDGFKYEKQEGEPSCLEIMNYLSTVERDAYSFINVQININAEPFNLNDALKELIAGIDIDSISDAIDKFLEVYPEKIEKARMLLRKIRFIFDPNNKTRCYRKSDFSEFLRVDPKYFSDPNNKWCKLYEHEQAKTKPLRTCAEIEYAGELFSFVKKYWNSKSNTKWGMNGLIKIVPDLKELFELGHDDFMYKRTGRTQTKPARS